jgi:hypothetical protein
MPPDAGRVVWRGGGRGTGQVLVIFAIALIALFAAAGLAFDIGRFYAEQRFLQNSADAGALAAANALIRGASATDADTEARAILARNFISSPNGSNPALPPATPVYEAGHPGDPTYLLDGILILGCDVRVAVRSNVGYTFGRIVGLTTNTIGGRAHVDCQGDILPVAVRHFINAPGPGAGAAAPCDGDPNRFQDLIATADTSCLGTETDGSLRAEPSAGMPFNPSNPSDDPTHHGPIIALVGQGATPSNSADFRGFVALDIRNFASTSSNVFYNDVTAGTQANVLKDMEAGWVATGYPGPDFPPSTTPPDPNDQVGIMAGNTSGIIVDAVNTRYGPGDEILSAVYSGTVMRIPDFQYSVPGTVSIDTTQNRDGLVTMNITKNTDFLGQVFTTAFPDWGDATSPLKTGALAPLAFAPDGATPPTTVAWTSFHTTVAPVGISTIWLKGHSPSPYLTDHYYPVAINVGGVVRDFTSSGAGQVFPMAATGQTATGTMSFSTPNRNSTYFGGTVSLTIEGGADDNGVLPTGIGTMTVSPSSFTLSKGDVHTVTVSLGGGTLGPGEYPLTIRATGTNGDGQKVTRLIPIVLDIATDATSNQYVDILGFAVFRITSIDSNAVYGYAISGTYADMNDPALRRGQVARLVPWD